MQTVSSQNVGPNLSTYTKIVLDNRNEHLAKYWTIKCTNSRVELSKFIQTPPKLYRGYPTNSKRNPSAKCTCLQNFDHVNGDEHCNEGVQCDRSSPLAFESVCITAKDFGNEDEDVHHGLELPRALASRQPNAATQLGESTRFWQFNSWRVCN